MSVGGLSKVVQENILWHLDTYENLTRSRMNTEITAMEISPKLLQANFNLDNVRAKELYFDIEHLIVKHAKSFKLDTDKSGVKYIVGNNSMLLIAKNFTTLRYWLTKYISHNSKLKGSEVGLINYIDKKTLEQKTRSKFDIGHTVGFGLEQYNAVASARVFNALNFVSRVDPAGIKAIQDSYLKKFHNLHIKYNINFKKQVSLAKDLVDADFEFVYTVPQAYSINASLGQLEKAIINDLRESLPTIKGSKSVLQAIDTQLNELFLNEKVSRMKSNTKVSGKTKSKKKPKAKVNTRNGTAPKIRDTKGRYTSTLKIKELLQPLVTAAVGMNMDSANYFKTQTGRFTKSVKIEDVIQSDRSVIVKYNYMQHPYSVFESGGSHHRAGRAPTQIISGSIRQAATQLVGRKFNIIPQLKDY